MTEWLCERWGVEKPIESPDYIVGLGSGVLKDDDGKLTRAGKNVVDTCFSLCHRGGKGVGVILIGGQPWERPPFSDVSLMHQRLLKLGESMESPEILSQKVVVLDGEDNTYKQIQALWRFLSDSPEASVLVVCPRLQSRRLRAILKKRGLLERAGIRPVDDGCEPYAPVEKFRWSNRRYLMREILACVHHRLHGWT